MLSILYKARILPLESQLVTDFYSSNTKFTGKNINNSKQYPVLLLWHHALAFVARSSSSPHLLYCLLTILSCTDQRGSCWRCQSRHICSEHWVHNCGKITSVHFYQHNQRSFCMVFPWDVYVFWLSKCVVVSIHNQTKMRSAYWLNGRTAQSNRSAHISSLSAAKRRPRSL